MTLPLPLPWRRSLLAAGLMLVTACTPPLQLTDAQLAQLSDLANQVETDRLMADVQALGGVHQQESPLSCTDIQREQYIPTCHLTHDGTRDLVKSRLEGLGLQVRLQEGQRGDHTFANVLGDLPGTTHPEEIVLVGAHFDAFYMGADDNSTGVAGVLELARILSAHSYDRTLRFVGFDLEELGDVGSGQYVDELGKEKLVGAIIFDCIGYYDTTPGSQASIPGLPTPAAGDFLAIIGNDNSLPMATQLNQINDHLQLMKLVSIIAPADGTYAAPISSNLMRSDHAPFWYNGQNALFLTDTANFRNHNYHQETDVIDTLAPDYFRRAVQVSAVGLATWAGGPR